MREATLVRMNDIITVRGTIGTDPKQIQTATGLDITTFRLASTPRRFDKEKGEWVDLETNWYGVSAYRHLARNTARCLKKGDPVVVYGRIKIRPWESDEKKGLAIDIDATKYPQGQRKRQPPRWVVELFEQYGFEYGGNWKTPDPMHFEFAGSITEARFLVASLAAGHLAHKPAPLPRSAPPLAPPPIPRSTEDPMFITIKGTGVGAGRFLIIPGGIPVGPMNDAEWMSARSEAPTVPHVTLTKELGAMALYNKR